MQHAAASDARQELEVEQAGGRQFMRAARLAAAAVIVLLSACGGGGGGSGTGNSGSGFSNPNYLPLDSNNRWLYSTTQTGAGTPATLKLESVAGTQAIGGVNASIFVSLRPGVASISITEFYAQQSDGLWQYPNGLSDPIANQIGPIRLIQYPVSVGTTFVQVSKTVDSGVDYDGDGKTDPLQVDSKVTVASDSGTVTTPAGTFANCLA